MQLFRNSRASLIALVVMIALVAVVFPTCRMIGCSMEMGPLGAMPIGSMALHTSGGLAAFSDVCDGLYEVAGGAVAAMPAGIESLLLSIAIALFGALMLVSPVSRQRQVLVVAATPPPPPHEPLGARFRV